MQHNEGNDVVISPLSLSLSLSRGMAVRGCAWECVGVRSSHSFHVLHCSLICLPRHLYALWSTYYFTPDICTYYYSPTPPLSLSPLSLPPLFLPPLFLFLLFLFLLFLFLLLTLYSYSTFHLPFLLLLLYPFHILYSLFLSFSFSFSF